MLPVTITGASTETRPSSGGLGGATIRDDAGRLGRGEVEVGPGDRVGRAAQRGDLVGPPRVPDPAVDGRVHELAGLLPGDALGLGDLGDELRPAALQHLGDPVEDLAAVVGGGAATTPEGLPGGRRRRPGASLREAWDALARNSPVAPVTAYGPPALERGNAPPMYSLYVFRTDSRSLTRSPSGRPRARGGRPRGRSRTPCSRRTARSGRTC